MNKYAWLEHDDGMWHFLTNLYSDPMESSRKWCDEQLALDELMEEGWTVVRPYPKKLPMPQQFGNSECGYGLMRTIH